MTEGTAILIAAGLLLVSAWALLVLYFWLTRDQQIIIQSETDCRGYCCERTAADRLNPRNT